MKVWIAVYCNEEHADEVYDKLQSLYFPDEVGFDMDQTFEKVEDEEEEE